nr:hypothetical protein [Moraxella sp. CTOTU48717]
MSTGHIKLWWSVKKQPDSFNIYHSLSPFSPTNLPVPVATGLAATTREFRHLDQEHQYDHYYRIASVKNGRLYVSRGVLVRKKPIQCIPTSITVDNTFEIPGDNFHLTVNLGEEDVVLRQNFSNGVPYTWNATPTRYAPKTAAAIFWRLLRDGLFGAVVSETSRMGAYWLTMNGGLSFPFQHVDSELVVFSGLPSADELDESTVLTIKPSVGIDGIDIYDYLPRKENQNEIKIYSCAIGLPMAT